MRALVTYNIMSAGRFRKERMSKKEHVLLSFPERDLPWRKAMQ